MLTACFVAILKIYEGGRHEQEKWLVKQCTRNGKAADKNCRHMEINLAGGSGAVGETVDFRRVSKS